MSRTSDRVSSPLMQAASEFGLGWLVVPTWALIGLEWLIRIMMIPVVMRKRSPQSAVAWLAVVYFMPLIGVFVYLLIGESHLGRIRLKRRQEAVDRVHELGGWRALEVASQAADVPEQHRDIERLAEQIGHMRALGGNHIDLIDDTNDFLDRLVDAIGNAERSAHLLYYIYSTDESGRRVSAALREAAARGVSCRLLVDGVGSKRFLNRDAPALRAAGVEIVAALPVNIFRALLWRIDLRNHRKIAVIDDRVAFTGSQNIINADYGAKRIGAWKDLSLRIVGPGAHHLQRVFLEDWSAERHGDPIDFAQETPPPEMAGGVSIQTAPSGPGDGGLSAFGDLLVACIHEAEEYIVMTTPYFVPTESVLSALRISSLRGVRVDLVMPRKGNHPLVNAAAGSYYDDLIAAGINVWLHTEGLLHAKTLSVDDSIALIGSGNFDIRSFSLNFELTQLLYGPEAAHELSGFHARCIDESEALDAEAWAKRGRLPRFRDNFARLLSPLL